MVQPITSVVAAVPARDEMATVAQCLMSIDAAAAAWGGPVVAALACDSCTDGTAAIARALVPRAMQLIVVEGSWGGAGATRRAGTSAALNQHPIASVDPRRVWLASTDADTAVPPGWLTRQVDLADAGADVVLGVVELHPDAPMNLLRRFAAAYPVGPDHPHVHAANLGLRRSVHDAVGGWAADVSVGEEHDLVNRAHTVGARIARRADVVVTTSGRTSSRVPDGFARHLAALL